MSRIDFVRKFISDDPYDIKNRPLIYAGNTANTGDVLLIYLNSNDNNRTYYGIYASLLIVGNPKKTRVLDLSINEMPLTNKVDEYITKQSIKCINDNKVKYGFIEHRIISIKAIVENILTKDSKYKLLSITTKNDYSHYFNVDEIVTQIIKYVNIPAKWKTQEYLEELFNDVGYWMHYKEKTSDDLQELIKMTTNKIEIEKKREEEKRNSIITRLNDDGLKVDDLNDMYFDDYSSIEPDVLVFEADVLANNVKAYRGVINGELVMSNNYNNDFAAIQKQFNKASKIVSTFCFKELKVMMKQGLSLNDNQLIFDLSNQLILHKRIYGYVEKLSSKNRNELINNMAITYKINGNNRFVIQDRIRLKMYDEQMSYIQYGDCKSLYDKRLDTYLWNEFVEAIEYNERMPYDSELRNLVFDKKHFVNFSTDCKDKFWMIDENIGEMYFKQINEFINEFDEDDIT